jgi:hypothetical protein
MMIIIKIIIKYLDSGLGRLLGAGVLLQQHEDVVLHSRNIQCTSSEYSVNIQ